MVIIYEVSSSRAAEVDTGTQDTRCQVPRCLVSPPWNQANNIHPTSFQISNLE